MLLDRWRARRALLTRSHPSSVEDKADPAVRRAVEELGARLGATNSLGDPIWHYRWEGEIQIAGLDATDRSVTDVRQRLLRLVHEVSLRHLPRRARRILAVVRCAPKEGEELVGWHARLQEDRDEVGQADWRAARRRIAVLALDTSGGARLFGGDAKLDAAVKQWLAER